MTKDKLYQSALDLYTIKDEIEKHLSRRTNHKSLQSTEQYVRLTAEIYQDILKDEKGICAYIFPKTNTIIKNGSIKVKKHNKNSIHYLTTDGIKLLLKQPDLSMRNGRRNLALLALMYDSGARVQEMIDHYAFKHQAGYSKHCKACWQRA